MLALFEIFFLKVWMFLLAFLAAFQVCIILGVTEMQLMNNSTRKYLHEEQND